MLILHIALQIFILIKLEYFSKCKIGNKNDKKILTFFRFLQGYQFVLQQYIIQQKKESGKQYKIFRVS
jgi:hypothetical protein